jgi:hypothetical protein
MAIPFLYFIVSNLLHSFRKFSRFIRKELIIIVFSTIIILDCLLAYFVRWIK